MSRGGPGKERQKIDPIVRFDNFVEYEPNSGCWLWIGKITKWGYSAFSVTSNLKTTHLSGHKFSYEYFVGPVPDGLQRSKKIYYAEKQEPQPTLKRRFA